MSQTVPTSDSSAAGVAAESCQTYPPTTFKVCGAIRTKYNQMGGPTSFLLFPKSNELTNPGGTGKRSEFVGGNIYWSAATGAHPVGHEFLFKWGDHGYETGFLKYPKTDEIVLGDGVSRRQEFQGGHIYWSALTGAHSIQGLIYDKWKAMGAETSVLGFPTSDETVAPDGTGRFSTFQGGAIYWHPATGAHPLYGPVKWFWDHFGSEASPYGYPTSDPVYTDDNVSQEFQRGVIRLWDGELGGVHEVDENQELDDTFVQPDYPVWPQPDTFDEWNTVEDPDGELARGNRVNAAIVDDALAVKGGADTTRELWAHLYEQPGVGYTLSVGTVDSWMETYFPEFTNGDGDVVRSPSVVRASNRDKAVATAIELADRQNRSFKASFLAVDVNSNELRWCITEGLNGTDHYYSLGGYSMSAYTSVIAKPGPAGQHPIQLAQQAHLYDVYDYDDNYDGSLPVEVATSVAMDGFRLGINKWYQVFGHGSRIEWQGLR